MKIALTSQNDLRTIHVEPTIDYSHMMPPMEFTGERMVPEKADVRTFWEHIYRYRFALQFVRGRRVLDIACGEGYGAAALQQAGAASLTGVDVSAETCAHAARRYGINTVVGDAQKIPLKDAAVDVVVSFETIEHLPHPELFLDECVRVLAPGGKLIVSTPNREVYDALAPNNPYHFKEMNEAEFVALLKARFANVKIYTQRPRTAAWWSVRALAAEQSFWQTQRGIGPLRWLLQNLFCREVLKSSSLAEARKDPIAAICKFLPSFSHLGNPFAIRPESKAAKEAPVYLVAVAELAR